MGELRSEDAVPINPMMLLLRPWESHARDFC